MEILETTLPDLKRKILTSLKLKRKFLPITWTIQNHSLPQISKFFNGTLVKNDYRESSPGKFLMRLFVKDIDEFLPEKGTSRRLEKYESLPITENGISITMPASGIIDWSIFQINDKKILIFCPNLNPEEFSQGTKPSEIFFATIDL
jgi:hypothetical protein